MPRVTITSTIDFSDPLTHVEQRLLTRLSGRDQSRLRANAKAAGRSARPGAAQARVWHFLIDGMLSYGKLADRVSHRLIMAECDVDRTHLKRILRWLEDHQLVVRTPGRGRSVLSTYGLHPRLLEAFFVRDSAHGRVDAAPEPGTEKGVTTTPLSEAPTPPYRDLPISPPTSPADRTETSPRDRRVDDPQQPHPAHAVIEHLPANVAARSERQRAALGHLIAAVLAEGYAPRQVLAAITHHPLQRPAVSPVGFCRARLAAMRTSEQPQATLAAQASARRESAAAAQRAEHEQRRAERTATTAWWQQFPRAVIAKLLGGMREHRGMIGRQERLAIRVLRGELEPALRGADDPGLALDAWITQQGWQHATPVGDAALVRALSAVGVA